MSDPTAIPELTPELYDELRELAGYVYRERGFGHATVQPTILLHEAWERLSGSTRGFESPKHFKATCAMAMRQIMVDRARRKEALKRGADPVRTTLAGISSGGGDEIVGLLDLESALLSLEALDAKAARIVVLRTFGGLTTNEVAEVLEMAPRSVERSYRFARVFLAERLQQDG
jgi:RNA polymerase sigma-70 factor (ECF subfamily)